MNTHAQQLNRVFSDHIKSWESIPVGDPVKILVEGVAEHLERTEERYRSMLDKVFFCAPEIVGIAMRPATPALVELMLQTKIEPGVSLEKGHEFGFKYLGRDFRAKLVHAIELKAGGKTLVQAEFSEIKQGFSFGMIFGEFWEEVQVHHLLPGFKEVLLRFPDESTRVLSAFAAEDLIRVKRLEELENKYIYARGSLIVPYAPGICAGYPSGVTLELPTAHMVCEPDTLKLELLKMTEVRGQQVTAAITSVLRKPIRAESQTEYAERVKQIVHRAQKSFKEEGALNAEEIRVLIAEQFPGLLFSLHINTESETLVIELSSYLDELQKRKMRRLLESKMHLRYEIALREVLDA